MRTFRAGLVLGALLLTACGATTNNSGVTTENYATGSAAASVAAPAASVAAPAASVAAPAASAAASSAAGGGGAANTAGDDVAARNNKYSAAPGMQIDPNKQYTATIETTKGTMQAQLYAKEAPITVNNFVFLSRDGFYDDVKFHRIISGFMVQTGDPTGTGTGGPGYSFADEPIPDSLNYTRGTLAMANAGPNTNGSQFFIMHQDGGLPKNYTIFGKLTAGEDVLDTIASTPVTANPQTGEQSVPTEDVRITKITINEQ